MCEVLLEFDDRGCISDIKTTYCANHPACCTLVGRLSRPVRNDFGHPQQYSKQKENTSPTLASSSSHNHHHGSGSSPTTASSPASAIFGKHLAASLNIPSPSVAHRRHVSSRSLLRTVSDVVTQQSLKRSASAPHKSPTPSPTRMPSSSNPSSPRLDVTNPDDDYFADYSNNNNKPNNNNNSTSAASPVQAQFSSTTATYNQSPVPYQANYCICLTFVYRCGHPVDDLKPSSSSSSGSGNGGRASSMKGKHMICGWACTKEGQCRHTRVTHAVQVPLAFGCSFQEGCQLNDGFVDSWTIVNTTRLCGIGGSGGGGGVGGSELKEHASGGGVVGKGVMEVLLESRGDEWR
ncbi:hypothetical protein PG991_007874 [Apiospora marii]|uniref:C2H2-type domain-containing protein n=1 Tax=Apiospora marii TaxID=335849 RepID=A0ABR1RUP8_9PEZI